ncbi:MAG: hypothetical protein IPI95_01500 [Flavobacteriales bacterium]|nr:hypothetical protein [Flavobacteriales bacterium]
MRHARKILFGTAAALVVMLGCASTQKAVNRPHGKSDPRWAAVDSLSNIGQFASALKATEVILAEARAAHDWRTEFRAWMYSARFMRFTGGDAVQVLAKLDSARNNAETPEATVAQRGRRSPVGLLSAEPLEGARPHQHG